MLFHKWWNQIDVRAKQGTKAAQKKATENEKKTTNKKI